MADPSSSPDSGLAGLSTHDLYETCVQSPADTVPLLLAIHGGDPVVLGEDFAGTAAMSRVWVSRSPSARAIAVDHDAATLAEARRRADDAGVPADRLALIEGDVRTATEAVEHAADVIYAGNFSIGELHDRRDLVAYLRSARDRLSPGGIFACDVYGGEDSFSLGSAERPEPGPTLEDGRETTVLYTWEQRDADPLTGRVVNAIHFEVLDDAETPIAEYADAYVYDWRLWSVPELRDAMLEAGFEVTEVHARMPDAIDDDDVAYVRPIEDPDELEDRYDVLVVGRNAAPGDVP